MMVDHRPSNSPQRCSGLWRSFVRSRTNVGGEHLVHLWHSISSKRCLVGLWSFAKSGTDVAREELAHNWLST